MTLANGIYDDPEDRDAAMQIAQIAQLIVASGCKVRTDLQESTPIIVETTDSNANNGNASRLAHKIAMRLKDSDKKFSGDLGKCWMDYVDEYSQVTRDYGLSPQQKLQYFHNLLSRDAKRFYLAKFEIYAHSFQQAVEMINREYSSPVRQTRLKNYFNTLRVSEFVKGGLETSSASAKVYKLINKLSRQVPALHRGDAHKIEFLRNAAVGYSWSREPLSRVATHHISFQMLYGELEAVL